MKFPRAAGGNEGDPRGRECSAENEGARLEWGGGDSEGTEVFRQERVRPGNGGGGGRTWKGVARRRSCKSLESIDSQGTTEVSYVFCALCM